MSSLPEAQEAAALLAFDFGGIHLVENDDAFDVFATELREPADGLPHPETAGGQRDWPIPVLG